MAENKIDKVFLKFELDRLNKFKKNILKGHVGYDEKAKPTRAMLKFFWIKELVYASISRQYWTLKLEKLKIQNSIRKQALRYVENIEHAKEHGLGFVFLGANGRGKTSTACGIAIELLLMNFSCMYTKAQTYIDWEKEDFNNENRKIFLDRIKQADFIMLDEIDKIYINEKTKYSLKKLEGFLRDTLDSGKMLVVCTNLEESDLSTEFNSSVYSLMQRYLKFIEFEGVDHSIEKRNEWDSLLDGKSIKIDNKVLELDALKFFKNTRG